MLQTRLHISVVTAGATGVYRCNRSTDGCFIDSSRATENNSGGNLSVWVTVSIKNAACLIPFMQEEDDHRQSSTSLWSHGSHRLPWSVCWGATWSHSTLTFCFLSLPDLLLLLLLSVQYVCEVQSNISFVRLVAVLLSFSSAVFGRNAAVATEIVIFVKYVIPHNAVKWI